MADSNNNNIPDYLEKFLNHEDFRVDWTNRRRVIWVSILGLGAVVCTTTLVLLWKLLTTTGLDYQNTLGVVQALSYGVGFAFVSIVGSYVFGAAFDVNNFRANVTSIIKAEMPKRQPDPNPDPPAAG